MNSDKLCDSAYVAATDPVKGPYLHAAGMVDRTSGTTHYFLVRGKCSQSVVGELQQQLTQAGRISRHSSRRSGLALTGAVLMTGLVAGFLSALLGFHPR